MFIVGIFLIFCGDLQITNTAPLSDSVLSHSVMLTFSNISLNTWHTRGKGLIMGEVIANLTTEYCQANPDKCGVGIASSTHFKSENVKTASNYPRNENDNLETLIYVEIPTTDGSTPNRIPGGALLTIITNEKSRLSGEIGYGIGPIVSGQTLSGSDEKEINNKLNKVMIPVAFLLLLALALVCWILHRGKKKKQAREERKRYTALQNSKNPSNLREKGGAMVNTADNVPPAQINEQPEGGPMPELDPPENQAEIETNNNIRRHKKRRSSPKKQPIRKAPADESDDVFDDDPDEREKPKKKGRRRKGRRSYNLNHDADQEYEMRAAKELACSQDSSEGTNGDSRVNTGYQRDSERGESDPARNSNTDSAVELSSSVASSANQNRARSLPPIPRANQNETV